MASVKTFRVNGPLSYNEMDDNVDNLNNDKIERLVNVNDSTPALEIIQSGSGDSLVVNTNDIVIKSDGKVGVGTATPRVSLDISGKDAISVTSGTTAERPSIPQEGDFRFNKTTKTGEMYDGKFWTKMNRNLNIEKITSGGYNGISVFGEGEIYFTSGNASSMVSYANSKSNNYPFQLGLNNFSKVLIPSNSPIIDHGTLGHYQASYALCANGDLYTWGYNQHGQCGINAPVYQVQPILATTNVVRVFTDASNGGYDVSSTALVVQKTDGYLYAAGHNNGRFGTNNLTNFSQFIALTNFGQDVKNAWNLGATYGCIIIQRSDNRIFAAGYNANGQFGIGTTFGAVGQFPVEITSAWIPDTTYEIKQIQGAFGYHTGSSASGAGMIMMFAENSSGQQVVRTAGMNTDGQCGNGTMTGNVTTAYNIPLTKPVKQILVQNGVGSSYILNQDGTLYSFGYGTYGQLGHNAQTSTGVLQFILTDVKYLPMVGWNGNVQSYYSSVFAVKNDGTLWATGYNGHGQACVGRNNTSEQTFQKCLIPLYPDNTIKTMGMYSTASSGTVIVAVREDNEIFGWGYNVQAGVDTSNTQANYVAAANFKIRRT